MNHNNLVSAIRGLAARINADVGHVKWYLFGSAQQGLTNASDIDVLVVCQTSSLADAVRRAVNVDEFNRPMHLSILTQSEEAEVGFVKSQDCFQII